MSIEGAVLKGSNYRIMVIQSGNSEQSLKSLCLVAVNISERVILL